MSLLDNDVMERVDEALIKDLYAKADEALYSLKSGWEITRDAQVWFNYPIEKPPLLPIGMYIQGIRQLYGNFDRQLEHIKRLNLDLNQSAKELDRKDNIIYSNKLIIEQLLEIIRQLSPNNDFNSGFVKNQALFLGMVAEKGGDYEGIMKNTLSHIKLKS